MSLRDQAALDARAIVEDLTAFGQPVTVTNPSGVTGSLKGLWTDIHLPIDVNTEQDLVGQSVSVRKAGVVFSIAALTAAGLGIPANVTNPNSKPWVITTTDVLGNALTYKVIEAKPDRLVGVVACMLETYKV